jgi:hypothetical protein
MRLIHMPPLEGLMQWSVSRGLAGMMAFDEVETRQEVTDSVALFALAGGLVWTRDFS